MMSITSDMSATDVPAADERPARDWDLALIVDLTMWYQMQSMTARKLTQLNSIQTWPAWCPYNVKRLVEARREDDTIDWYFPLLFATDSQRSWKGIHHISAGEIHVTRPLALPPLNNLPPECTNVDVLASAGGLLLLQLPSRPEREGGVLDHFKNCLFWTRPYELDSTMELYQKWRPLVVSNPLTKEWRELPAADCRNMGLFSWDYVSRGLRVHMVVDDEANSYKVILISRNFVCVYKSTSNSWKCNRFPASGPCGRLLHMEPGNVVFASAVVDGRVCFADLEYSNSTRVQQWGDVRVFEIDEEAGTWKPPVRYALQHFFQQSAHPYGDHGFRLGSNALKIVECMGLLYAVVPTKLVQTPEEAAAMEFFPLQFRILQLSGAGSPTHGVLRIQNSFTGGDSMHRSRLLSECTIFCWSWFRCTARGSVIWVTFEDYLLQFDVLSGQSQTHMMGESMNGDETDMVTVNMCYRPSFHMKP